METFLREELKKNNVKTSQGRREKSILGKGDNLNKRTPGKNLHKGRGGSTQRFGNQAEVQNIIFRILCVSLYFSPFLLYFSSFLYSPIFSAKYTFSG